MATSVDAVFPGLSLDAIAWCGSGLVRPECVLATAGGDLYTADWRGGVAHISRDGTQALFVSESPLCSTPGRAARPNGIALRACRIAPS